MSMVPYDYSRGRPPSGRRYHKSFTFDAEDFAQVSFNVEATVFPRSEKKVSIVDSVLANQDAREIERESLRIQREMERERRARSASPAPIVRPTSPMYSSAKTTRRHESAHVNKAKNSPQETPGDLGGMFAKTSKHFSKAEDEIIAGHELKTLRQALVVTRKDLKEAEGELKNARELSDDARSNLMVVEFKRGNASKDLERIVDDIKRKKGQLSSLGSELNVKAKEVQNMHALGLTKEDCMEVKNVKEENLCLKTKVRNLEGIHLERDELLRQLDAAKEDVLRDQKQARLQRAEMQEQLEGVVAKLEESQNQWGDGQVNMSRLEAAYRKMEKEKNQLIQEKLRECEELKIKMREDSEDTKSRLKEEMNDLDLELSELKSRVSDVRSDSESKDSLIEQLRAQLSEQQSVMAAERQERHKTVSEQKKALHKLKKETSAAVLKLKESMFLDKQKAMEDLKVDIEQERRENGARSDDRVTHMLKEHSQEIQDKNEEIVKLQEMMRRMENDQMITMEQQIREAVSRERERVEKDKDWHIRKQKDENNKKNTEFLAQMEREKQTKKELHKEMTDLRKELEEQRRQQRESSKEKLVAIARAKDQAKEQSNAEMDRVRFNMREEHQRELDSLREKLRCQEDELSSLQTDKQTVSQKEREAWQALEHAERTVISEINEECHKVSKILGISPRTVHHSSFRLENADGRISPSLKSRSTLNAALANLRAGNEELHNHIAELQQEVESLRTMVETVTKEKEEAIENCRLQMEKQRTLDLEKLKEKLLKLEIDAVDLSQTEAQFPQYTPNVSFRLDFSRDSDEIMPGNEHIQEMSNVIRECAESNSQLKTNNHHLQRYGDAALLEALQSKEDELSSVQSTMGQWQSELEDKYTTRLQLQMAKEREKYQALQHHSTREQKRISDLQKREIDRLEREVKRLAAMTIPHSKGPLLSSPVSSLKRTTPLFHSLLTQKDHSSLPQSPHSKGPLLSSPVSSLKRTTPLFSSLLTQKDHSSLPQSPHSKGPLLSSPVSSLKRTTPLFPSLLTQKDHSSLPQSPHAKGPLLSSPVSSLKRTTPFFPSLLTQKDHSSLPQSLHSKGPLLSSPVSSLKRTTPLFLSSPVSSLKRTTSLFPSLLTQKDHSSLLQSPHSKGPLLSSPVSSLKRTTPLFPSLLTQKDHSSLPQSPHSKGPLLSSPVSSLKRTTPLFPSLLTQKDHSSLPRSPHSKGPLLSSSLPQSPHSKGPLISSSLPQSPHSKGPLLSSPVSSLKRTTPLFPSLLTQKDHSSLPQSQNSVDSNRYEPSTPHTTTSALETNNVTTGMKPPSPVSKSSPNFLKARIKQLQTDNDLLRKQRLVYKNHLHLSNPNLSQQVDVQPTKPTPRPLSPTRDHSVLQRLEERMRLGEQESLKTEERAKLNQKLLNNKMAEMTKLQNTLTSQNQELQDLEKAYSELHKHYNNTRPMSPNRYLNTTL